MKIQPIDSTVPERFEPVKAAPKSRLKRFFDFSTFLRGSAAAAGKDCTDEFEPSSVSLDKMVRSFIEEHEKPGFVTETAKCVSDILLDDELDSFNCFGNSYSNSNSSSTEVYDPLKSLVLCETICERNLLVDVAKIVDKNNNKICKKKDEMSRKVVTEGLLAAGYTVSMCKSRWEKTSSYPAGEYEYIDVVIEGERLIIDIDFRSEFEIARSTKSYKAVLQTLPQIFVGKPDRLQKIINIVSDAAKQSLKKKGMPLPPWRRADYVKAKWLSPCNNQTINKPTDNNNRISDMVGFEEEEGLDEGVKQWEPLEIEPKVLKSGGKVVSGLASVIEGK
ncbi:uncharacterized protein LOC143571937 [Bidens hawaiensis]|uniref:uncharacterized protein LOC143571937 n=1 Tax=Bidens hawaiensis TaxID=980011 RepID=UPI00404B4CA1